MAAELILHHYAGSPFAEKICAILGFKGAAWKSVRIPPVLPRPDLAPLTGSHRRTPALQRGADVYCDTRCITAFLERELPTPTLFPEGSRLASDLMSFWAEPRVFVAMAPLRFRRVEDVEGIFAGAVGVERFVADRTPFMRGALDVTRSGELLPAAWDQVGAFLDVLDRALTGGGPYLVGRLPSLADFSAFHLIWWLDHSPRIGEVLDARPHVCAWFSRMRSIGHGRVSSLRAGEALEIAQRSEPAPILVAHFHDSAGRKPGDAVRVVPDDYGRDELIGELVFAGADEVVVRREDPRVGAVNVHFPRIGFQILPA